MENIFNNKNLIKILKDGGVVVLPTDTLYGIVGNALNEPTVERIYKIRKRAPEKPCIILIGDISELKKFFIKISEEQEKIFKKYWFFDLDQDKIRATSIVLDCQDDSFEYLHRGTKTLAFRIPSLQLLRDLLIKTGPLIAPSANIEGMPFAKNISEAKKYFGNLIDLYIDGGEIFTKASKVINLNSDGSVNVLRP